MARRTVDLGVSIGKRLRLAQKEAGLTVRALADKSHVSAPTIMKIRNGGGGSMAIGLLVGEGTFAQLDAALGDRLADLGLGIVGAFLGALAHEVVATLRRPL